MVRTSRGRVPLGVAGKEGQAVRPPICARIRNRSRGPESESEQADQVGEGFPKAGKTVRSQWARQGWSLRHRPPAESRGKRAARLIEKGETKPRGPDGLGGIVGLQKSRSLPGHWQVMDTAFNHAGNEVESNTDRGDAGGLQRKANRAVRVGLRGAAANHFICDFEGASHRQTFCLSRIPATLMADRRTYRIFGCGTETGCPGCGSHLPQNREDFTLRALFVNRHRAFCKLGLVGLGWGLLSTPLSTLAMLNARFQNGSLHRRTSGRRSSSDQF
jgi:hypothetical protein